MLELTLVMELDPLASSRAATSPELTKSRYTPCYTTEPPTPRQQRQEMQQVLHHAACLCPDCANSSILAVCPSHYFGISSSISICRHNYSYIHLLSTTLCIAGGSFPARFMASFLTASASATLPCTSKVSANNPSATLVHK